MFGVWRRWLLWGGGPAAILWTRGFPFAAATSSLAVILTAKCPIIHLYSDEQYEQNVEAKLVVFPRILFGCHVEQLFFAFYSLFFLRRQFLLSLFIFFLSFHFSALAVLGLVRSSTLAFFWVSGVSADHYLALNN